MELQPGETPLPHRGSGETRRDSAGWVRVCGASRLGGSRKIPRPGHIEHHQLRPDRALLAGFAIDRDDGAADRRRQFDRSLVGHDVDERVLLADLLPGHDMPFDDLGLGRAFADIGKLDDVAAHLRL